MVFLGLTVYLLIGKYYYVLPYHALTWLDIMTAFHSQLFMGLFIGGPLLLARCVAERRPLVGAVIMLILAIPFVLIPIMGLDTENWAASIGLIYIVPALLYLASWRKGRV